jgi:hypothetical protein
MKKYAVEQTSLYGPSDPRERKTHPMWTAVYLASEVDVLLNPRRWTQAQNDAWHRALPDVRAAFEALRNSL